MVIRIKRFNLEGIFPALVTPFKNEGEIDEEALRYLVNFMIEWEVNGVVPVGTTGEFVYMSKEERKRALETVIDEVNGRVPVIAGTGASSTIETIELCRHAKDVGADATLVVTPYYLRPADKGAYQHFYEVTKAADIPIVLYNIPQCTGGFLSREVVEDLARIDNITGLKDSSGHLPYMLELLSFVGDKITIVCGHDEVVLPALAAGAKGAILASANVIPDIWVKLYKAVQKGDVDSARKIQMSAQKLARIFCRHGGAVAVKAALKMMSVNVGKVRRPLVSGGVLAWEVKEEIRMELEKLGKITAKQIKVKTELPKRLEDRFQDLGITAKDIEQSKLLVSEASVGEGREKLHVFLLAGPKQSAVGYVWARALANPEPGHEALTAILEPNLSAKPITLIVPAIKIESLRQASIVYGPVQSAVGKAVSDTVEENVISKEVLENYAIIVKVVVNPEALNRQILFTNTYDAVKFALSNAFRVWRG
ncbi:MAG: 4-hydroxy-tetrahydrodipicolinate synthase [Candidatus Bathyarchaeota archaeon]|nr:4-hydroxy-tetrahydrodipicolinate synthase [Candidatus Bathyarchaeota archaeon]